MSTPDGISDAIRYALESVRDFTGSVQEEVRVYERQSQPDAYGNSVLGAPVLVPALVARKRGRLSTGGVVEFDYKVTVSFLGPMDLEIEKIVLADGTTGLLYEPEGGLLDPLTGKPFVRTIYIK